MNSSVAGSEPDSFSDKVELSTAALRRLEGSENGDAGGSGSTFAGRAAPGDLPSAADAGKEETASARAAARTLDPLESTKVDEGADDGVPGLSGKKDSEKDLADVFGLSSKVSGEVPGTENTSPLTADLDEVEEDERVEELAREAIQSDEQAQEEQQAEEFDPFGLSDDDETVDVFGNRKPDPEQFAVTLGYGKPDLEQAGFQGTRDDKDAPLFGRRNKAEQATDIFGAQSGKEAAAFGFAGSGELDSSGRVAATSARATEEPTEAATEARGARRATPVGVSPSASIRIAGPPAETLNVNDVSAGTLSFGDGGQQYKVSENTESVFGATGNVAKIISAYLRQANAPVGAARTTGQSVSVDA